MDLDCHNKQNSLNFLFLCNAYQLVCKKNTEKCPSGRRSALGKRMYGNPVPRVRIPPSPPNKKKPARVFRGGFFIFSYKRIKCSLFEANDKEINSIKEEKYQTGYNSVTPEYLTPESNAISRCHVAKSA